MSKYVVQHSSLFTKFSANTNDSNQHSNVATKMHRKYILSCGQLHWNDFSHYFQQMDVFPQYVFMLLY